MRKPVEKRIGSFTYRVTPLGAKQGCQAFTRVTRLLGSALKGAAGDKMAALGSALESLKEEDVSYFCDTFSPMTEFNAGDAKWPRLSDWFEEHFAANYGEMVEWLYFAMEVNFGSFFAEVLAKKDLLAAVATPPFATPAQ